jgi:hypothetical protein
MKTVLAFIFLGIAMLFAWAAMGFTYIGEALTDGES